MNVLIVLSLVVVAVYAAPQDCSDEYDTCDEYPKNYCNEDSRHYSFMSYSCKSYCDLCDLVDEREPEPEVTDTVIMDGECVADRDNCAEYPKSFCTHEDHVGFMTWFCPMYCGLECRKPEVTTERPTRRPGIEKTRREEWVFDITNGGWNMQQGCAKRYSECDSYPREWCEKDNEYYFFMVKYCGPVCSCAITNEASK